MCDAATAVTGLMLFTLEVLGLDSSGGNQLVKVSQQLKSGHGDRGI